MRIKNSPFAKAALAAALLVGAAGAAEAQSPPPVFDGRGFVTDAVGCAPQDGFAPPVPVDFVFRPAFSIPGTPEGLQLNIIGKAAALIVSTSSSGKLGGQSNFETTGISYWSTPYGNGSKPGVAKLVFTPANVAPSTKFLTITGTLKNLTGNPSCVITITAALTKRAL